MSHSCLLGSVTVAVGLSLSEYKKRPRAVTSCSLRTAFGSAMALSAAPTINVVLWLL